LQPKAPRQRRDLKEPIRRRRSPYSVG